MVRVMVRVRIRVTFTVRGRLVLRSVLGVRLMLALGLGVELV